jgi:hypothetical protein
LFAALLFLLAPQGAAAQETFSGIQDEIPEGANRIVLEQREITPSDVYLNALYTFRRSDWEVIASEDSEEVTELDDLLAGEEEALAFTARGEVSDDLALRIAVNVEPIPAGGRLIASVDYAANTPTDSWQDAAWTTGREREAFFEALEVLRRTAYDNAGFEVGVAVEPEM